MSEEHVHHHSHLQPTTTTATTRRHDLHQTPRQSSPSGARRKSSRGNESKKKQPQRGMGVAQLERLRLGERLKKMTTEINQSLVPPPSLPYAVIPTSFPHDPTSFNTVPLHLGKLGGFPLNLNQKPAMLVQRVSNINPTLGFFHGQGLVSEAKFQEKNLYGVASNENSKELSSSSNLIKGTYSDRCSVCHQKKRNVNGERMLMGSVKDINPEIPSTTSSDFVGLNAGNQRVYKGKNQDFGKKATFYAGAYSVGNINQGVEVVAVHRTGSSSGDGSGSLVMEYEFFPCGRSESHESDQNELMLMKKLGSSEPSSSISAAVTTTDGCAAVDGSISVDLSLRLSY